MPLADCRIIELPKIHDPHGNLTFVQNDDTLPFTMQRVYYVYDVPGGAERGGHAHKNLHQFIVAMSGSFDITLDDGKDKKTFHLARSYYGLYVCPMIWREIDNFSSGSVLMCLASEKYSEADYHRSYDDFMRARWANA
ncbi:MAG: sugar 3,4-ketoisomerase [Methylophilus sp.]|uniref:sugar 3,4-ketoisomerase n=1 Tax=Methylophilus sp. TaxID=29541 RepID=UPI003F9EC351